MKAEIKPRIDLEGRTRLETVIPLSTPYLVFLDPSDKCNMQCAWCPTGSGEALKYKKPQNIDFELYKKIIDDLCDMPDPIKTLRLYSDGEPLLNSRFVDMVGYAKSKGRFGQVDTTSNGNLLNTRLSRGLVSSGLDKIFISVPRNYDSPYRWRIRELHNFGMKIYVKTIGDGMTEEDKFRFMADFGDISDRIFIENLAPCWPGYDSGKVSQEWGIYGQPLPKKPVKVCPYLFYSAKINSDGTVSACFLDWRREMFLGDLKQDSFMDIWNGELLRDYRYKHLTGQRWRLKNCGDCGQLRYGSPDNIDRYAKRILRRMA